MDQELSPCDRLRELVHQNPRAFGKPRSTWTLDLLADACFELGIVGHRVSRSTMGRTLGRMGMRWKRAKLWQTSPDPEYALKKARRDRLIEAAAKHPDWTLGFEDEVWWSRLQRPRLRAWTDGPPVKVHVLKNDDNDPDPVSICCYGILRNDTRKVMLRFAEGRPLGATTIQYLEWLGEELEQEGKKRLIVVWDDASWHASTAVLTWIRERNDQVWRKGGVEIIHFELPARSPWLNNIEPCYMHAKKAIIELDRKLTKQETVDRVCQHFGCTPLPFLRGVEALNGSAGP
jgi:DDE superfamily endonuclease